MSSPVPAPTHVDDLTPADVAAVEFFFTANRDYAGNTRRVRKLRGRLILPVDEALRRLYDEETERLRRFIRGQQQHDHHIERTAA